MTEVIEAYRGYAPPCDAAAVARSLLESLPPDQLVGLWQVVLTNTGGLQGQRRRGWSWARGKKVRHAKEVAGLYHQAWRQERAWIEVFVDKALASAPVWALSFSLVRDGLLGAVLYHELGHHLHKVQRPEYREREAVADQWSSRLLRQHFQKRHRLAALVLTAVARVINLGRRLHTSTKRHDA